MYKTPLFLIVFTLWMWSMVPLLAQAVLQSDKPVNDSTNWLPVYSGEIYYKGEVLNEIRWIDHPGVTSDGIFSFPVHSGKYYELYTPWKEGFSFYPEVVKFDENNTHQVFSAIKLSLTDDLIYQFKFEKGIRNQVEETENEHELFSGNFEMKRGGVKYFVSTKRGLRFNSNEVLNSILQNRLRFRPG